MITVKEQMEIIPIWNGNLQSEKPFSVVITPMTRREMRTLRASIKFTKKKGFREDFTSNSEEILDKIFLENTVEIKGLKDPFSQKVIATAEALYDTPGMDDLITEVIDYIQSKSSISPEQVKNSAPPSDGT